MLFKTITCALFKAFTCALEAIQSHLKKLQKKQKNVKMFRKKDHEIFNDM